MIWFIAAILAIAAYVIPGAPDVLLLAAIGLYIIATLTAWQRAVHIRHEIAQRDAVHRG